MPEQLPTFDEIRATAFALVGDVEDVRCDLRPGTRPTNVQAEALHEARWDTVTAGSQQAAAPPCEKDVPRPLDTVAI